MPMMLTARLPLVLTFFTFVACGGATAIVPDDETGGTSGNGGATSSGSVTGAGGKPTGGVTGAGGRPTGGVTGAGGKATFTGGVTGAGGRPTGGVTGTRWAKEYDQSCSYDGDCVGVTEGPVCTCNSCLNAGINRNELKRWDSTNAPCGPIPCDSIGCQDMVPVCRGGSCGVRAVDYIQPGQFDRTCSNQGDCYLVPMGDLCSGCNCEFDAISEKGLEEYKQRVASSQSSCGSPGIECGCVAPQAVCRPETMGPAVRMQCAAVY